MRFAWKVAKHVKVECDRFSQKMAATLGVGAGQMSRPSIRGENRGDEGAISLGTGYRRGRIRPFFPFPDGVEEAAKAGATAVIQPGGIGARIPDVIAAATRSGLAGFHWYAPLSCILVIK